MYFSQLLINSIISGSIYCILALGFNFAYGPTRFFNLAYGSLAVVGGYVVYTLIEHVKAPLPVLILGGVLVSGLLGWLVDRLIFKTLRAREASGMVFLVASLGCLTIIQSVVAIIYGSQFRSFSDKVPYSTFQVGEGVITSIQLIILIVGLVIGISSHFFLKYSDFGKSVKAIADDPEVAKIVGIRTEWILGWVFFISSCMAGLAGILVSLDIGLEPTMGMNLLLKAAIASIIGAIGSMPGAILGAYMLGFVENLSVWKISSEWKEAVAFGLLIIFLLVRPHGLLRKK